MLTPFASCQLSKNQCSRIPTARGEAAEASVITPRIEKGNMINEWSFGEGFCPGVAYGASKIYYCTTYLGKVSQVSREKPVTHLFKTVGV